jgi:hypothetical protein
MRTLKSLPVIVFVTLMVAGQEPPVLPPTQDMPKLPELSPPVPRLAPPPRLTADWCSKAKGRCTRGYHFDCGPQWGGCVPNCPKGYRAMSSDQDVCTTPKRPCVTVSPLWPIASRNHDWGWQASLCDPKAVVVSKVDLIYPERAIQEKRQGTVDIWGYGDEDGKVETHVVGTDGDF